MAIWPDGLSWAFLGSHIIGCKPVPTRLPKAGSGRRTSEPFRGHHITTPHATQHHTGLVAYLCLYGAKIGAHILQVRANLSILLFFFLIAEMDDPSAFDCAIRFSVSAHQRSTFDRAVAALPIDFLRYPVTGEVFVSKAECKARLQGFALSQGFTVVVGKSSQDGTPRAEFLCIHHGIATQNDRGPEDEVEKDSKGKVTSKRQRDNTQVMQKLRLAWRGIFSICSCWRS